MRVFKAVGDVSVLGVLPTCSYHKLVFREEDAVIMYNMLDTDCIDSEIANVPITVHLSTSGVTARANGQFRN